MQGMFCLSEVQVSRMGSMVKLGVYKNTQEEMFLLSKGASDKFAHLINLEKVREAIFKQVISSFLVKCYSEL